MKFSAGPHGTVVEVEHRGWERLSEGFRAQMHEIYVRGWLSTLGRYAQAADRAAG